MIFCDTHTHLDLHDFSTDLPDVIRRAEENEVKLLFLPNLDTESLPRIHAICEQYPGICFPMAGLHPGSVTENFETELSLIKAALPLHDFCAIGETGTDLYHDNTFFKQQQQAFLTQLLWAEEFNLPIVIHTRNSFRETMDILLGTNCRRGVFHCFSGNVDEAREVLDLGFYLGIGGVVTFKNAKTLHDVVKFAPLDRLLLETDAPFLAPAPHRGKRNEPAYIPLIANAISLLKGTSPLDTANITTANAIRLFLKDASCP
ncbi:MAG: TatD family hydrolase [Bacteroidetes bacterium]|nr:TatD family hydrolase [Bacteroidota bacterium]MBU1719188.1 TatD family hydrolase [Bacteroidota bacterium]